MHQFLIFKEFEEWRVASGEWRVTGGGLGQNHKNHFSFVAKNATHKK